MIAEEVVKVVRILETDGESYQRLETDGGAGKALLYLDLFPEVEPGDQVLVNTTATVLQLGTGGWDIVRAVFDQQKQAEETAAHIMKARYLPSQHSVLSVDDPAHPDHSLFQEPFSLKGVPVLLAELHSMLPIIFGMLQVIRPEASLGVIISDEASLPMAMSRHLQPLKRHSQVTTVSIGQAFGAEYEATTLPNALQWLKMKKDPDLLLITMGPGSLGTNTPYGFSGMALSEWAHYVYALEGYPLWVARMSFADQRRRHQGISHHTLTPLLKFTHVPSTLVLPQLYGEKEKQIRRQMEVLPLPAYINVQTERADDLLSPWREWCSSQGWNVQSMGRTDREDPIFFESCAAAVRYALSLS